MASDAQLLAECEYLAQAGYLVDAPESQNEVGRAQARAYLPAGYHIQHERVIAEFIRRLEPQKDGIPVPLYPEDLFPALATGALRRSDRAPASYTLPGGEIVVSYLLRIMQEEAVPLLTEPMRSDDWSKLRETLLYPEQLLQSEPTTAIVNMLITKLPVPGDDVPLDAILDFCADEDTRRNLASLGIWVRRAAQSGRELQELAIEIDESLHQYSSHMRLADMQSTDSALKIALSLPLAIVEELLHLRPKRALDVVYEYRDRKATRLEAELSAPGGALAYIYKAERRFKSTPSTDGLTPS